MKKLITILILAITLASCSNTRMGEITEVTTNAGGRCTYEIKVFDMVHTYQYEIDSCGKYNVNDTVQIGKNKIYKIKK